MEGPERFSAAFAEYKRNTTPSDAERAGSTSDTYLCRWGCGNRQSLATSRDRHEQYAHGGRHTGTLAAEVDRLKAEADALRTALVALAAESRKIAANAVARTKCPLCSSFECECWTLLIAAITSAEAALKGAAK